MNQNPETTNEGGQAAAEEKSMPGGVLRVDESMVKSHLDKVVVSTVEQTLNAMLDAEAELLCKAGRYEHTEERVTTRAGHYDRQYHTKAGEVTLRMPNINSQLNLYFRQDLKITVKPQSRAKLRKESFRFPRYFR